MPSKYYFFIPDAHYPEGARKVEVDAAPGELTLAGIPQGLEEASYVQVWQAAEGSQDFNLLVKTYLIRPQVFTKDEIIKFIWESNPDDNPAEDLKDFHTDVWYAWVHILMSTPGIRRLGPIIIIGSGSPQPLIYITNDLDARFTALLS